jgi:hypothetical protein
MLSAQQVTQVRLDAGVDDVHRGSFPWSPAGTVVATDHFHHPAR